MRLNTLLALLSVAPLVVACATSPDTSAAAAPPAAAAPAGDTASKESLTIEFDQASVRLSPTALSQLDGAARLYRDAKPQVMIVSGHSDKTGTEFSNLLLSARRAELVKQGLVDRGVPAERLQIVAIGSAEPTPNTRAARAAVVTWR